jgi:Spy/CpxP family protein refolding chaperone
LNSWKVIFATLVIFITGVVTGALLVGYASRVQRPRPRPWLRDAASHRADNKLPGARGPAAAPKTSPGMPKLLRMDFLKNLNRELQLTEDQRRRIEAIISEGQEHNRQLWMRELPEMRRQIQRTKERIRQVLDPEQLERFEELMKQRPQRKANEMLMRPDSRFRDQPPRPLPTPDGPQPRPPAEQPANP